MTIQSFLVKVKNRRLEHDNVLRQRLLIISGVLVASAFFAPKASPTHLVLLLGAGAVVAMLRCPPLGLVALIISSLLVPFALDTGTQSRLNATVLLLPVLLGLWGLDVLTQREPSMVRSRPILPLLVFLGVAVIAFLAGTQPSLAFAQTASLQSQLGGLAIFVLSAGAFLLVAHQVREELWLRRLTWLFLGLGAIYIAGRSAPELGGFAAGVFQSRGVGGVFWIWLAALSFGQAAFNRGLALPWRLALAGLVIATFYVGLFQTYAWLSGWLPAFVAVVVTLWVGAPRLGSVVVLIVGVLAAVNASAMADTAIVGDNQYSLYTRLESWRVLWEVVRVSPVLGLGPANYYWYTSLFPLLEWHANFSSHNNYLDIIAQTGVLGLAAFLWFCLEAGWLAWRLRTRVSPGFARAYVYGALGGLAGMLVAGMLGDWVLPFVYNVGFEGFRASVLGWVFLGGLLTLEQVVRQRSPERHESVGPRKP